MRTLVTLSAFLFVLTACTAPQVGVSSPGMVIGNGPGTIITTPVMPVPGQPVTVDGSQVSTTSGILVDFRATSTVVINYTGEMQHVCVNVDCADLPAGYVVTSDAGAAAVTQLSVYGAELTFNSGGSYMRPTSGALITTRRITTHHGAPIVVGDNIPGGGEAWPDLSGQIVQLVIEHLE